MFLCCVRATQYRMCHVRKPGVAGVMTGQRGACVDCEVQHTGVCQLRATTNFQSLAATDYLTCNKHWQERVCDT
jgi:hypothetical protein